MTTRSSLPELGAALVVGLAYGGGLALLLVARATDCTRVPDPFGGLGLLVIGILGGLVVLPLVVLPVVSKLLHPGTVRRSFADSALTWFLMVGMAGMGAVVGFFFFFFFFFIIIIDFWDELMRKPC